MKRLSVRTLSISLLCAALACGCGFFARFGLDKQVAKVEEAKQKATVAEANRFAVPQFQLAENTYRQANGLKDQGEYKQAKEMLAQAAEQYLRAAQMAPTGRRAFEEGVAQISGSLEEVRGLVEQARAAGAEQLAPELLTGARQALAAAINEVASATGGPSVEPAALVNLATPGGSIDVARITARNLLKTTLATQVAQASQEMTVLWNNLQESGAGVTRASEVAELDTMRGNLTGLLAKDEYAAFLAAYPPFRERTLAMVKDAFEARLNTALEEADASLQRARSLGAEEHAAAEYAGAAGSLDEARAARDAANYSDALAKAQSSAQQSKAAVTKMQQQVDELLTQARQYLDTAQKIDAAKLRPQSFNAGKTALEAAEKAKAAGDADTLLTEARRAEQNLRAAVEETRKRRTSELVERAQLRLSRLTAENAAGLAPEKLSAAEDAFAQLSGKDAQTEFDGVLEADKTTTAALDQLEEVIRTTADKQVEEARALVEKAEKADEGRYAPAKAQNARRVFDVAADAMKNQNYAAAIQSASEARLAAEDALTTATLARTREKVESAGAEEAAARAAGAESFAAQLLSTGQAALVRAQALLVEGSGESALEAATLAMDSFSSARLYKIAAAESARRAAEVAKAPELEAAAFAAAAETLASARQAMNERQYDRAHTLADQAAAQFAAAESGSWRQRAGELAPKAEAEILFLTGNLAPRYATENFRPVLSALMEMRGDFTAGLYKGAFESAEECLATGQKARSELATALEAKAAREQRRLAALVGILRDEEGLGMAEGARQAGRVALSTRQKGGLRDSFVAYEALGLALDGAIQSVVAHNRQVLYTQRKAQLDAWRATGAEPLAANTFKSLSDQIESLTKGPNTLEEYERVRGADEQIGAELDSMEETVRVSTDQLLAETRSNLESAAKEGAGRIFPAHFTKAEEAWRTASDLPKGRNYPEIAAAVVNANQMSRQLLDTLRLYSEEERYRTAAYDVIDKANNLLKKFAYVIEVGPRGWLTAQASHRADLFAGVQRVVSASEFYLVAQTLEQRIKEFNPPPTLVDLHRLIVQSFEELTLTGELFQKYGDYTYGTEARKRFIAAAFEHYNKREKLMLEVDKRMLEGSRVQEAFKYEQPTLMRRADNALTRMQESTRGVEKKIGQWIWGYEL